MGQAFSDLVAERLGTSLRAQALGTVQVNVGFRCNQQCFHCHLEAGPERTEMMSTGTVEKVLEILEKLGEPMVDVTGGAPELNPELRGLVRGARAAGCPVVVRTNLTSLRQREGLMKLFAEQGVSLMASMPCYIEQNVEAQRGRGVYGDSIDALKRLNELGYGRDSRLSLDLVYNPGDAFLPPDQQTLEQQYRGQLEERFGIVFDRLIAIANMPIGRFARKLEREGRAAEYGELLRRHFNEATVSQLMCIRQINIGPDGTLYDCDFNLALRTPVRVENHRSVETFSLEELLGRDIATGPHCFGCTAGAGSSCRGALSGARETSESGPGRESPRATVTATSEAAGACSAQQTGRQERFENVKDYYGRILRSRRDLKTSACTCENNMPAYLREKLNRIHPEVLERFYGCGSPIPPALEGCTVLDLGCGTGRDVFLASSLVGPAGSVTGVDMIEQQLQIARRRVDHHTRAFDLPGPNMEFRRAFIEDLAAAGVENDSVDVIMSNCVINLSPHKRAVFSEILRVLRPGGELYFSDIFAGRRLPEGLRSDPVLVGECLGGALYIEDFRRLLRDLGCPDYRVVERRPVALKDTELEERAGMIDFYSMTIRAFKLLDLEDICEDYGQVATYMGNIPHHPHRFILDDHHLFETGRPVRVCGNTASMLQNTRYAPHFEVVGNRGTHFGPFPCGPVQNSSGRSQSNDCCC